MQAQLTQHIIWNSIKELLHRHDCVIVPDFGGFVCNREQSRIDQVSHIITPPAKRIVFNQNLKTNDGLLAQTLSEKLAITYSEALRSITDLVNQLRTHLEQLRQLDIEAFGSFRLNADANYVFLPDRQNTYLHSSFGLLPLQAIPVSVHKGARQTRIFKDRKEIREARRLVRAKHVGLKLLTGALVIMLLLNGYIFLTDANLVGGAKINTTGINSWFDSLMNRHDPVASQPEPEQEQTLEREVIPPSPVAETDTTIELVPVETVEPETDTTYHKLLNLAEVFAGSGKTAPYQPPVEVEEIPVAEVVSTAPVETTEPVIEHKPAAPEVAGSFSYHVIGGVFCKEKNARKFYNKLREQGFNAELLLNKKINCNRVSYRKLTNLQEAIELMDSLKATENPEAWVLTIKE